MVTKQGRLVAQKLLVVVQDAGDFIVHGIVAVVAVKTAAAEGAEYASL